MNYILEMVNYYSLETLGMAFNMDRERIDEIIATHESGQNQFQDDPSSVYSNYLMYDSFTLDNLTKYRLYFANTVGWDEEGKVE
jgi:hypothetical protein